MSGSVAGSIPCMSAKNSLGSSTRYVASNFTDVIVIHNYTMSNNYKWYPANLLQKRNDIIPMPMKGLM